MTILQQNEQKLHELCELGLAGKYKLPVKEIGIPLTNVCNCHCIMCHACNKDYPNHTYYNEEPYATTLEQYKKIFPNKNSFVRKIFKKGGSQKINFCFGSAETLTNKNVYEIFKYTKTAYPNSNIRLISNGTIPPSQPDIVKYIDRIGFSIDGANPQTYEMLRTPAKFSHTMECLKKWDDVASDFNDNFSFGFGVVVSTANIYELGDIFRFAKTFRHIDSVFVQPIILHETKKHLSHLLLSNLDKEELNKCIENAVNVANEIGIRIDGLDSISAEANSESPTGMKDYVYDGGGVSKYCRYMWNGIISLTNAGEFRYFCCYMDSNLNGELMEKYKIENKGGAETMYNSKVFWQLRKDFLEGKLLKYCKNCSQACVGYEKLSKEIIKPEDAFYV